jgi:Putative oxidoreductase C terminal domain
MRSDDVPLFSGEGVNFRKEIIARENLTVMGVVGRYIAAYAKIDKMFWWDKDMACGPIVEQGTHFGRLSYHDSI